MKTVLMSVLMGVLAGLSFGGLAAQNCNDIKTNCIDNYNRDIEACGKSSDRQAEPCKADAQNRYLSCVQTGGCGG